jgi:hypothetical protein
MPVVQFPKLTPARQAERILAAWAAGNQLLLQQELLKSQCLECEAGEALDQERLELLMALSEDMLRTHDPLAGGRRHPSVRRCLDLLAHLATASRVSPGAN